jgi:hypothetical protein
MTSLTAHHNQASGNLGYLVVVGSGMDAVRHLTPEARAAIEAADKVFYCVCDALVEVLIRQLNPNTIDLFPLYSESYPRYITYRRMTDTVVNAVISGLNVCMVFYGHPAVCATSPHAAVAAVRRMGGSARILPGVSAHDALFAELGVDPGLVGCQIYEATSYLTRLRSYDVNTPLVLYQLAAVGDLNFYESGPPNICLHFLRDMLTERYGASHEGVLYTAPSMPFLDASITHIAIGCLDREVVKMAHTLLVPPLGEPPRNQKVIDEIHRTRDAFYLETGRPLRADWPEHAETFDEHPGARIYNRSE